MSRYSKNDTGDKDSLYHAVDFAGFPMFTTNMYGTDKFMWGHIYESGYKQGECIFVRLTRNFYLGDVFVVKGHEDVEFIIKKKISRDRSNFLYKISLLNQKNVVSLHLDILKKGREINIIKNLRLKRQYGL